MTALLLGFATGSISVAWVSVWSWVSPRDVTKALFKHRRFLMGYGPHGAGKLWGHSVSAHGAYVQRVLSVG